MFQTFINQVIFGQSGYHSGGRSGCGDREARDTLLALAQDKKGPLSVDHVTVLLSWVMSPNLRP